MKRIFKRNQVIITSLVIMIIVAGYLNFTADKVTTTTEVSDMNGVSQNVAEFGEMVYDGEDTLIGVDVAPEENQAMILDENGDLDISDVDGIGEAVLTSTTSAAAINFSSAARLSREQTRSKNKETLQGMIDNENVTEELRTEAANDLLDMTKIADMELATETMLEAKGFANSVVSINEESVDVVICLESLSDMQKAQIEDIVMRKAECGTDKIVITTLKSE